MNSQRFMPHMHWPDGHSAQASLWFCVRDTSVLVTGDDDHVSFPDHVPDGIQHVLGSLGARTCLAVDGTDHVAPAGTRWCDLRRLYRLIDETAWAIAARAVQVVEWDRTHRHCGRCGMPTVPATTERVRRCPKCHLHAYPRVSPAVIVLVTRGDRDEEALLAWGTRRQQAFYSTLAGFVEPGETLEEALEREIKEEVGIDVTDIAYFGSQSWPFPHQLMVGYRARYAGGEIVLQASEIREARWFAPDDVRQEKSAVRGRFSIAGKLIDGWLAEQAARNGG
jgi:NAD+ diphosphatase